MTHVHRLETYDGVVSSHICDDEHLPSVKYWTGPCLVDAYADAARDAGWTVVVGTEHVYVDTRETGDRDRIIYNTTVELERATSLTWGSHYPIRQPELLGL